MQRGEKVTIAIVVIIAATMLGHRTWQVFKPSESDPGIPYYSTADQELKSKAGTLIRDLDCRKCHSLWGGRGGLIGGMTMNVPAPRLDGIGSLRDEEWLLRYLSAQQPQQILPSRLKEEFQMPSYAHLPENERRLLASYLASLKVEDWYLDETRQAEREALQGKPAKSSQARGD